MQTANTDKTLEKEEEENDSCTGRGLWCQVGVLRLLFCNAGVKG